MGDVDLWCCKRSAGYSGRLVSTALQVKVTSLNLIRYSIGSEWNCLISTADKDEHRRENDVSSQLSV